MRLSTSSSNDRLPKGRWITAWVLIIVFFTVFILLFEIKIQSLGWTPSLSDSQELWSYHRKRASDLGSKAFILVGASRIQLGLDLDEIRKFTNLEPVQLAIDGTTPIPVLESLADDPRINGTIILSITENLIQPDYFQDKSYEWVRHYNANYGKSGFVEPYKVMNRKIQTYIGSNMVTRLEGAKPYTVISKLAFSHTKGNNYLVTNHDRSRSADYTMVRMPDFYAARVIRHYGMDLTENSRDYHEFLDIYTKAINEIMPDSNQYFITGLDRLLKSIREIENRGGKVIIVRFPMDKLIWEIDRRKYPREKFWDELAGRHDKTIHFEDHPMLSKYNLPDGSHLDYRDKKSFTRELMKIIDADYFNG